MKSVERLFVFCEGQTEETFANVVLAPYFMAFGAVVRPLLLPNVKGAHSRRHKGGWNSYRIARHFMNGIIEEHHSGSVWFTTLFDYYALPGDYPQPATPAPTTARDKAKGLEIAMARDLLTDSLWRFTPHLQLHEFEALLLADVQMLIAEFPDRSREVARLKAELAGLAPEEVNGGPATHPSMRIISHIPEYEGLKASAGPILASRIGLPRLRQRCPHFADWLSELEQRLTATPDTDQLKQAE
jgi:hypothetical protein